MEESQTPSLNKDAGNQILVEVKWLKKLSGMLLFAVIAQLIVFIIYFFS